LTREARPAHCVELSKQTLAPSGERALPYHLDLPTGLVKSVLTRSIPRDIPIKFSVPELGIRSRPAAAGAIMAVPKTAMDENRRAKTREDNVRTTR
jgi:hypothetical protein